MGYWVYVLFVFILISFALLGWVLYQRRQQRTMEKMLARTIEKLERLQTHFGRFTPEEVIEHLTESDGRYQASTRQVCVLFADLKGFTKMCHEMEAEKVLSILNGYFRYMTEIISAHHGQVTEMMGDGLLALFGALRSNPWQVQDAVRCALAMRKGLDAYNAELAQKGLPRLSFGIGIHQGEVLAGVMGNLELSKFGVVGDAINVASRVEALTRTLEHDLLITEEVKAGLDGRFKLEAMPPVPIKGKETPIQTFYVAGMAEPSTSPEAT